MGLLDAIKKLFGGASKSEPSASYRPPPPSDPEPLPDSEPEIEVVTVSVTELMTELQNGADLLLLDCRELYEHQMVHIPNDLHIPMDEIPQRLDEITAATNDKSRAIVVYCASGMRSHGVTHYLTVHGFSVRNLGGGMTRWQMLRGPIARG